MPDKISRTTSTGNPTIFSFLSRRSFPYRPSCRMGYRKRSFRFALGSVIRVRNYSLAESMLAQPKLHLRNLPLIIDIAASPLLQRKYSISHPALGQHSGPEVFETIWPHDGS